MKTLKREIQEIFDKIQITASCHQKFSIKLNDIYKKTPLNDFLEILIEILYYIVCQTQDNSVYVKRSLNFVSRFCGDVTKREEKEGKNHDFLSAVVEKTLQWTSLNIYDMRYNSCYFIALVLQDIGEDIQLEINLIDLIQQVMLERMKETKIPIRITAMSALVRLQDPLNFECPVIQAYIEALSSGSAQIRKEAVDRIAPNRISITKIKDRIRDSDASVRLTAFHKCADIGPAIFRIVDKQMILLCGFNETDKKVKDSFLDYLLPKWLNAYKGNYLKFIGALKLSADDEDISKMTYLSREMIKDFYNKHPLDDLISVLPVNEEKLINFENLSNDVTLFWNILTNLFRENDNDEYLDRILPDLSPFCLYIDKFIKTKSLEKMDEWKFLDYQFDLLNLFGIAEDYDFSDEVGRRNMYSLITRILQDNHFTNKLTNKLVFIAQKCSTNLDFFTNDMCNIISEIKEPLVIEPISEKQKGEREFKAATLKVKLNVMEDRQSQAIENRNYKEAQEIEDELHKIRKQLEELENYSNNEKIRVSKSDNETLCHCLDILASVLELAEVSKLTPSLVSCKDNFLIDLICNQEIEIHWRVLKCLALFSLIDKPTAEEYAKLICYPIATYRTIPISNISALLLSINGVTDLISLFGVEIISDGEEMNNLEQNGRRKLYTQDNEEDRSSKIDNMTLSYIFDVFLDMLDDERDEIRHKAILAICALVAQQFPITASIFSRLLLKWYNPLTEKQDNRLQIYLGRLIDLFIKMVKSETVIRDAIIPTITSITRAPKDSPLADIDIDNVVMFFAQIMNIKLEKDDRKILSLDICMKISENPNDRIVPILTKFLYNLDLQANLDSTNELMNRFENILENLPDKNSRRYTEKIIFKLKQHSISFRSAIVDIAEETSNLDNITHNNNKENGTSGSVLQEINDEDNVEKPKQVKRRKNRTSQRECIVVLEKLDLDLIQKKLQESTLHTIVETSMEMEIDNITSSEESSKNITRSNVVVQGSDTSDNDSELRKSTRIRKKRIVPNV